MTTEQPPMSEIPTNSPKDATQSKSNDKEYNFAQLRKKQEQTELELAKEREERARIVSELESIKNQRQGDKAEDDDDEELDSEPYIDRKALKRHFKKYDKQNEERIVKTAEAIAQKIIEKERKNNEAFRFKTLYPDFDEVLNETSAQKLNEKHKDLAEKILQVKDETLRREMAYQAVKSLNLHKPEPVKTNVQEQVNQKQKSLYYYPSSVATPPSSASTDFSEVGKKQAYEKMQSLIRNRRA